MGLWFVRVPDVVGGEPGAVGLADRGKAEVEEVVAAGEEDVFAVVAALREMVRDAGSDQ